MWKNETTCTGPLKRTDSRMFIRFIVSKERNYIVGCGSIVESKIIYMDYHVMGGCRFFFWFGGFFVAALGCYWLGVCSCCYYHYHYCLAV